jgi:DNA-binding NarL/FixJ family response regulator
MSNTAHGLRADAAAPGGALASTAPPSDAALRPSRTAGARILCVEDDRETAALLSEELTERGYQVRALYNGADGLAAIVADPPDLVLCDLSMPLMSGFEVLEQLRLTAPQLDDLPFVFLTALADRQSELKGRWLGADDYVVKPIDFERLDAIVATRLRRSARAEGRARVAGLSEREAEILTWAARGKTSDEISGILSLTRRTVDFHLNNARGKLGVATRTQAVAKAMAERLIRP